MPPKWRVVLVPDFEAELKKKKKKLGHLKGRLASKIAELEEKADSMGEPLTGALKGCRRIHVGGSYRLVYAIIDETAWLLRLNSRENDGPYTAETASRLEKLRRDDR